MNCTLNSISAFPFESFLGRIKLLLRSANRPLAQICRRLHELDSISKKASIAPTIKIVTRETGQSGNRIEVRKLKYKDFILTTKSPNNLVLLENGVVLFTTKIISWQIDQQNVQIQGNQWKIKGSIFKYPTKSEDLEMWELARLPSRKIIQCDISKIKRKMIKLEVTRNHRYRKTQIYAISFLHN